MNATHWATVCETVRPVLSDRCLSCVCLFVMSCLSATLVYCGRITMKLGVQVGLGPGHIVLDGDPDPPQKGAQPTIFGPCLLWPNGWMHQVTTRYRDRPRRRRHCVRRGHSSPSPKGAQPPIFGTCQLWSNGRPSQLLLS